MLVICEDGPTNGRRHGDMPKVDAKLWTFHRRFHDSSNENSFFLFHIKVHNGGSILDILDDMVRVGHSMGYNLDGCLKDMERIIGSQGDEDRWQRDKDGLYFLIMDVKSLWGNSNFDFVASDSLGNSGGILCIWEASIFKKDGATISDNFIAIYGTWFTLEMQEYLRRVEDYGIIRISFSNGVDSSDRKISWVAWDNVLASKLNGGLGVSSFFALNRSERLRPILGVLQKELEILVANDVTYPWGYNLCDGIYPEWVSFVKSLTNLSNDEHKRLRYKAMNERAMKDVERVFGALKKQ
ncbi:RNA-directed DNA polymerase, eukaryota [Tanacetum coccineum]